jgi:predicted Zn-dependent protease
MPQSALPHLGRADAYSADKNWKEAKASADRAIALAPQDPAGFLSRVQILLNTAEYGPARDEARSIQKKWPAAPSGYLYEAKALVALKDLEGADRALREGLTATGDSGLLLALYDRLAAGNQTDQANREIDAWMAKHPNDARVLVGAGELRQRRGDWRAAVDWYQRAAKLQPKNAVVLNNLAWALGKLGDKSALSIAKQALALSPNEPAVLDTTGSLNVEFGDVKEGITLLESAVARSPYDAAIRINLIRGLVKEKRTLDATRQIQAAMPFARTDAAKQELEKLQSSL